MYGVLAFLNIATYLKERTLFNRESSAGFLFFSFLLSFFLSFFLSYLKQNPHLYSHHNHTGYYYTSAYFVSNFLMSGFFFFFICVGMCAIIFYLVEYPTDSAANFGKYTLICYINLLIFQSMVEWLSASFKNVCLLFFFLSIIFNMMIIIFAIIFSHFPLPLPPLPARYCYLSYWKFTCYYHDFVRNYC